MDIPWRLRRGGEGGRFWSRPRLFGRDRRAPQAHGRGDADFYKWIVDDHVQGYGTSVDVMWTSVGWKGVALVEKANGTTTCVLAIRVMVKYVRREIRSLSDRDRETFLQAAMVLQRVPTEVGQRMYGAQYFRRVDVL